MLYWSSRSCSWTWNDPDCLLFMAWSCFSLTFPSTAWHLFCFSFFLVEMNEQDIRYRDILGHGNGGTVYKWVLNFTSNYWKWKVPMLLSPFRFVLRGRGPVYVGLKKKSSKEILGIDFSRILFTYLQGVCSWVPWGLLHFYYLFKT